MLFHVPYFHRGIYYSVALGQFTFAPGVHGETFVFNFASLTSHSTHVSHQSALPSHSAYSVAAGRMSAPAAKRSPCINNQFFHAKPTLVCIVRGLVCLFFAVISWRPNVMPMPRAYGDDDPPTHSTGVSTPLLPFILMLVRALAAFCVLSTVGSYEIRRVFDYVVRNCSKGRKESFLWSASRLSAH